MCISIFLFVALFLTFVMFMSIFYFCMYLSVIICSASLFTYYFTYKKIYLWNPSVPSTTSHPISFLISTFVHFFAWYIFQGSSLAFLGQPVFGNKPNLCSFSFIFLSFCTTILQKTQKKKILTSVWSAQHPNAGDIYNICFFLQVCFSGPLSVCMFPSIYLYLLALCMTVSFSPSNSLQCTLRY